MTWLPTASEQDDLEGALSASPRLRDEWKAYAAQVLELAPDDLAELCRLRLAQLHVCEAELRIRNAYAGVSDEKVEALSSWQTSDVFTPVERAALQIAENWAWNVHGITDDEVEELRSHLGNARTVALMTSLSLFDVHCRLRLALDVDPRDVVVEQRGELRTTLR